MRVFETDFFDSEGRAMMGMMIAAALATQAGKAVPECPPFVFTTNNGRVTASSSPYQVDADSFEMNAETATLTATGSEMAPAAFYFVDPQTGGRQELAKRSVLEIKFGPPRPRP
jgi:hypothetical protein